MFQLTWRDATEWNRHGGDLQIPESTPDPYVSHAGLLLWEEHCVECSMPQCYTTCSLYVARPDRKCARFAYGIFPNHRIRGLFDFGADIRFRRWAKLETAWPQHLAMQSTGRIRTGEKWFAHVEQAVSAIAVLLRKWSPSRKPNGALTWLRRRMIERRSSAASGKGQRPDAFFVKCFSPESAPFGLQLELVTDRPVFRTRLQIEPGWNQYYLDAGELIRAADGRAGRLRISIENDQQVRVIFTWLDFVCFRSQTGELPAIGISGNPASVSTSSSDTVEDGRAVAGRTVAGRVPSAEQPPSDRRPIYAQKVKCVAWDLDNTLWHGVIGDTDGGQVEPNREMLGLIQQFDDRGILQTIVSKNNHDTAWSKVEELGLADYFLYPAIHWGPKSRSVQQIAEELNINVDTFAVIDDSPFERHEISTVLPQVRVFDPAEGPSIIERPEFDVPISHESRHRRQKYMAEARRRRIHQTWRGDYDQFLKSCNMTLRIRRPAPDDRPRCVELLQRSNQFNLSGRRYSAEEFDQLLNSSQHECYCFEVSDDFGGYGIVGFGAFQTTDDGPALVDFVLSCRVAQKMVEATFVRWYARRQQVAGSTSLLARLVATDRNAPLREALSQVGFRCLKEEQDQQLLELAFDQNMQPADVITVDDRQVPTASAQNEDPFTNVRNQAAESGLSEVRGAA